MFCVRVLTARVVLPLLLCNTDTGDVFSWGRGAQGRLGLDTREDKFSPAIVATLLHQKTTQIAAGNGFSAALTGKHPMSVTAR